MTPRRITIAGASGRLGRFLCQVGLTKLIDEQEVRRLNERHYILRVASLFGGTGLRGHRATIDYIVECLITGVPVRAMVDRTVSPSYVPDVARAVCMLVDQPVAFGTYHCVSSSFTTWQDPAQFVATELNSSAAIDPINVAFVKSAAPRPQYCALSTQKLHSVGIEMPPWESTVLRHIHQCLAPATF
jgi:dTDP-4-dehydrorhamnose reductase